MDEYTKVPVAVVEGFAHVVHMADAASRGRVYLACDDPERGRAYLPDALFPDTLDYGFALGAHLPSVAESVECTRPGCREALGWDDDSPRGQYMLGEA